MKRLILITLILFSGLASAGILEFNVTTDKAYRFYLPTDRDASHVLETKDGVQCIVLVKHKQFVRMLCDKGTKRLVFFEERSPEIRTTIMTPEILIRVTGIKEI